MIQTTNNQFIKAIFILVSSLFVANLASAQTPLTIKDKKSLEAAKKVDKPWMPALKVSSQLQFGSSQSVIGQVDGDTTTVGFNLNSGLNYREGSSDWRQTFTYAGATSKSPSLPKFVKSSDEVNYRSLYIYHFKKTKWISPYFDVSAKAPVFKGEDVRAEATTYQNLDTGETLLSDTFRLTDGFKPLTTKQSIGAISEVIKKKNQSLLVRLGFGALQVDADNQLVLSDDSATENIIEVKRLRSYSEAGIEAGLEFSGKWDKKSSYALKLDILYPLNPSKEEGDERSDIDLTNVDASLTIASKIYDWASVEFISKAIRQPLLLNDWQLQNNLQLKFNYDFFSGEKKVAKK